MILVGELDDWSLAKKCRDMIAHRSGEGSPVSLEIFQGARHAFDAPEFKTAVEAYGHRVEYNPAAAEKSFSDVRAFLKQAFGG